MDSKLGQLLLLSWMALMMTALAASLENDEKPDLSDPQWSVWSQWSPCSRTCDGGATYQTRICLDKLRGCSGRSIRYQICNMQPCPELVDFRLQQCSNFNTIPYQGKLNVWVPHADSKSPCALWCRSLNATGLPLVVQLASRVHDGTRCKPGSLDMCIDGICQPVGCDLQLNSDLKIDACGVCGGDGSSCSDRDSDQIEATTTNHPVSHHNHHHHHHHHHHHADYQWEEGQALGPCSASCDGGEQEVEWICRNKATGAQMSDSDCDGIPRAKFVRCNVDVPCPPKWVVEPWNKCSVTCGGGVKERRVYCQQGRNDSKVDDVICTTLIGHKARTHEPCNTHECPRWFEGPWSECSTTCGTEGFQTRIVVCRDARGHVTNACPERDQPPTSRPCPNETTRPSCPTTTYSPITTTAPNRPPRQKVTPFSLFDDDEEEENAENEEQELKGVLVRQPGLAGSIDSAPSALLAERLQVGEISLVPTDPTFIAGEWSQCSVSCGDGTREREVHCKIFLEFSKTIATLPDKECPGPKPIETEPCFMRPCSLSNKYEPWVGHFSDQSNYNKMMLGQTRKPPALEDLRAATKMELTSQGAGHLGGVAVVTKPSATSFTYVWRSAGFSQCSASCLGGVQESIIECVRESDGQRVSPHLCPMDRGGRPDSITRTCNDIPCPPRWNTSDFSTCTRTCGGGVQTREVHCIHEVARGGGNTLPVGADLCPQPPPRAQQFCNMIDCPVEWKTGEWSQCSSTCEGGFRVRKVTCQQVLALGQVLAKMANHCNPTTKPTESKPCNTGRICSSTTESVVTTSSVKPSGGEQILPDPGNLDQDHNLPTILSVNQTFVQPSVLKKKVTLKIGGRATVYKGTQVKIRCPVKHYDRSKIVWMKDHTALVRSQKHEFNKKGMLRIKEVTYSDSGVYSCIAGRSVANITLTVRPTSNHNNLEADLQWETFNTPNSADPSAEGNNETGRSNAVGNKADRNRGIAGKEPSSAGAWPGSLEEDDDEEADEEEEDEEEEDELKEMKGNSLLNGDGGKSYPEHPTAIRHPSVTTPSRNRPMMEVWTEDSFGQIYSDQDQLLWPLQQGGRHHPPTPTAGNKKKNKKKSKEQHRRAKLRNASKLQRNKTVAAAGRKKDQTISVAAIPFGDESNPSVILGKGKAEQLKFEWLVTPWSKCSQTCGGSGFQVRAAQCIVRLNNVTKSVEAALCEDAGLTVEDGEGIMSKQPTTIQKCGMETCPKWQTGSWTPCNQSRCFTWNTALQKRPLDCVMSNGTVLDPMLCNERDKPTQKRECFNENCRGTWKVSEWSHCTATCDSNGHQSRILHCVWNGTDLPAGLACADLPRLPVTRSCRGPKCPKSGQCRNQSDYCDLVQTLDLCYIPRYREHCCHTCRKQQKRRKAAINKRRRKIQQQYSNSSSPLNNA